MVDIHLYGYNIHNWRYGGIESELHVLVQANMDLRVLYKTKMTVSVSMRRSFDYNVLVLEATRKHPGGVRQNTAVIIYGYTIRKIFGEEIGGIMVLGGVWKEVWVGMVS